MSRAFQNLGFRIHFLAYVLVNAILIAVNYMHPEHIWFYWPLLGWGAGIIAHGYAVSKAPVRRPPPAVGR